MTKSNDNFHFSPQEYEYMNAVRIQREQKRKPKIRICTNCKTTNTPSWRRSKETKQLLCNACGLYAKLHGKDRPFAKQYDGRTKALKNTAQYICMNCKVSGGQYFIQNREGLLFCKECGDLEYNLKMYHSGYQNMFYYQQNEE